MTRHTATNVVQLTHDEVSGRLSLDLVAELAEPLAEYLLSDYGLEDWQDGRLVETLARVAALYEAEGRALPGPMLDVLRKASEAGQPIGLAVARLRREEHVSCP